MSRPGLRLIAIGFLLLLANASVAAVAPMPNELYELINERLNWMEEVAAYKWLNKLPVEDAAREATVVAAGVSDALRFGVVPQTSEGFFRAQIQAAKDIQSYWFGRWGSTTPPDEAPDLVRSVRPELLRLGGEIVAAWAARQAPLAWDEFANSITVTGLSTQAKLTLFASVRDLRVFDSRLQQVLETRQLRIGTTGDYPPFSHRENATYTGIDIDFGRQLAAALGVAAVFVETSWPTLLSDLIDGRYDIAMSGVSRTLERQKLGFLSNPYYVGGKTPLARCEDVARLNTLAKIDRPGVRVIVNPGGTNEQFLNRNIHVAHKLVHNDNRTIFQRLLAGEADVMITDRIEAQWQAARNEGLCTTMTGTLSYQEKAYLLPQDVELLAFVNTWLDLQKADGTIAEVFARHLALCGVNECKSSQ